MSDSVEHRVEMHKLAESRRRRGRPVWEETIDLAGVFHSDKPFPEKLATIVLRIQASRWYKRSGECSDLHVEVENLSEARDEDEFDETWETIYDLADYARVWIKVV